MEPNRRHDVTTTVLPDHEGMRVDVYLSQILDLFPRSQIQHRRVACTVNGRQAKLSQRLGANDALAVSYEEPEPLALKPESIPLDILYEDDDVIVINKPAGMVVHPAAGNWHGTVVQALLGHVAALQERFPGTNRPGIVHRLDKETTGVLIAGKRPESSEFLARQFKARTTKKTYLAMVKGHMARTQGTIASRIARDPRHRKRFRTVPEGGKDATTHYRLLHQAPDFAILELEPRTGRTHQLRVHLSSIGHPIVGDAVYGRESPPFRHFPLMLHALRLEIDLSDRRQVFTAPLPERFEQVWPATLRSPLER